MKLFGRIISIVGLLCLLCGVAFAALQIQGDTVGGFSPMSRTLIAVVILFMFVALLVVMHCRQHPKISALWASLSVVCTGAALILCIVASSVGILAANPAGNPQDTVTKFLDSLIAGDYEAAYSCLDGYSSLGLENPPSAVVGKNIYAALQASYAYELCDVCSVDQLEATQQIRFTYLDLPSMENDVQILTMSTLNTIVQSRPRAEVYDADDKYLPDVTQEAYSHAVNTVLANAADYYVTTDMQLQLSYRDGSWLIVPDQSLLRAIIGGTGY